MGKKTQKNNNKERKENIDLRSFIYILMFETPLALSIYIYLKKIKASKFERPFLMHFM